MEVYTSDWMAVKGPVSVSWEDPGPLFFRISPAPTKRTVLRPATSDEIFPDLFAAILRSRSILQLSDDWDDEGSSGYSEATWWRAVEFLLSHAIYTWQNCRRVIDTPRILPGPEGSIDIHWESPKRELLVNVPPGTESITFYGDDRAAQKIKGALDASSRGAHGLLMWLTIPT